MKFGSTKVVPIGNSQGVRLPKTVIDEGHLEGTLAVEVKGGKVILSRETEPRAGWAAAFREMAARGDDALVLGDGPANEFDDSEWQW